MYYNLLNKGFIKPEDMEVDVTGFEFYLDAFRELQTARPVGLGISPIPFTAIAEYFKLYELEEDFDDFRYIIRKMDNAYIEASDNASKESNSGRQSNRDKNSGRHKR